MSNMRPSEDAMRRLGDAPDALAYGGHEPSRFPAMARKAPGYRTMPVDEALRKKFETERQVGVPDFLRLRETLEMTNIQAQLHPIHDIPFFGQDIFGSSGLQSIGVSTTDNVVNLVGTVAARHLVIVRTILITTFDALAETDLRISVRTNGLTVQEFARNARLSAFMAFQKNCFFKVFENQTLDALVTNNSAVNLHTIRIETQGWRYPLPEVKETARGIMPKLT